MSCRSRGCSSGRVSPSDWETARLPRNPLRVSPISGRTPTRPSSASRATPLARNHAVMFSESAAFYDLIYSAFKDYPAEAAALAGVIRREHPRAKTILDVACGTGEHARLLAREHGFDVDGLDLDPAF